MAEITAKEFKRLLETGQIEIGKKGRLKETPLSPEYAHHLKKNNEPTLKTNNKRVNNAQKQYDSEGKCIADSKLELKVKTHLETLKIPFLFQVPFILTEKTKCNITGKTIRGCTWKIDFVFSERKLAIDAKGYVTEVAKLKYKFFKKIYPDWDIVFVKNINEINKIFNI